MVMGLGLLPRKHSPSFSERCDVYSLLGTFQLTKETTLTIPDILNHGFLGLLLEPDDILRANQFTEATAVTLFPINLLDSHTPTSPP
jgi:hypothetical protein